MRSRGEGENASEGQWWGTMVGYNGGVESQLMRDGGNRDL